MFDDDHYYMGGVIAEVLASRRDGTVVTPSAFVSDWTLNTLEQAIHRRLGEAGVRIVLNTGVAAVLADGVETACSYTGAVADRLRRHGHRRVAAVGGRALSRADGATADWADAGIRSVKVIGDACAPGPIAWATYAGHRYARELDMPTSATRCRSAAR